jgi:hypothetical protein
MRAVVGFEDVPEELAAVIHGEVVDDLGGGALLNRRGFAGEFGFLD